MINIVKIKKVIELLKQHQLTLVTIESATCGLLASWFGDISGVSNVYFGGLITYQTIAKTKLLGISNQDIDDYGVVSEQIAKEMVNQGCLVSGCNCAISVTGVAGPSSLDKYQPGQFYVGIQIKDQSHVYFVNIKKTLDRNQYRNEVALFCLDKLISLLSK